MPGMLVSRRSSTLRAMPPGVSTVARPSNSCRLADGLLRGCANRMSTATLGPVSSLTVALWPPRWAISVIRPSTTGMVRQLLPRLGQDVQRWLVIVAEQTMRIAGEAVASQAGIENGDLAAGAAELQRAGETGKAAADDDDVIHGDGLRVVDGGGWRNHRHRSCPFWAAPADNPITLLAPAS